MAEAINATPEATTPEVKPEQNNTQTIPVAPTKSAEDELKELKASLSKANALISKANGEAAEWKRKYTATLDETKQKEMKAAEEREAERAELELLRSERRVNKYAKQLMESGYDAATAEMMAKVLPEGVGDEFFSANKNFLTNQRKGFETERMSKQPSLSVGMPPSAQGAKSEEDIKLDKLFGL